MQKTFYTAFSFIAGFFAPPRSTESIVEGLTIETLQQLARFDGTLPYHEPAVRALVWELKYRASAHAKALAGEYLAELLLAEAEDSIGTLVLIPMPMHKTRKRERGHNQTELLCEAALGVISGEPARKKVLGSSQTIFSDGLAYAPEALVRTRATVQQQGLQRHVRLENIKNCMEVAHVEQIKGRVCIVVDDVTTTGATFAEARRALKAAGASEVRCIALAQS